MKPQTKALNIGNYACLIFCDMYLAGIPEKELGVRLWLEYERLVDEGIIDSNCYAKSHDKLLNHFGCNKQYIRSETPPVNKPYISNYLYNGKNHFVVKQNGKIVFNSLESSNCVNCGKEEGIFRYIQDLN